MSKYETFGAYPQRSLLSAEAALLTVWPSLSRYHDDLVLVGGLAIYYLTRRDVQGLPGAITLDVDLGISLAASGGQYGTIKSDLEGLGFVSWDQGVSRLFMTFPNERGSNRGHGGHAGTKRRGHIDEPVREDCREGCERTIHRLPRV